MPFVNKMVYTEPAFDYRNYALHIRGTIINDVAELERLIDNYIATHFCHYSKKKNELLEVIISTNHLTYGSKATILRFILERRGDATHKEATQIYNSLTQDDKISYHRNILAHCELDTSQHAINMFLQDQIDKPVSFIKFASNKKITITYKRREMQQLLFLLHAAKELFNNIKAKRFQQKQLKRHTPLIGTARTKPKTKS